MKKASPAPTPKPAPATNSEPVEEEEADEIPQQEEVAVTPAHKEPTSETTEQVVQVKEEPKTASNDSDKFLPEIPSHAQYLIIGGGTSAMSAFKAIRASDPTAKVSLNEK